MSDAHVGGTGRVRPTAVWVGVAVAAVAVGAAVLVAEVGADAAVRWLVPASVVVAWECVFLARRVDLNRPPAEVDDAGADLVGGLGVANAVTLVRGLLYAGAAGFLLTGPQAGTWAWAPASLYGVGAALDAVDGAVARGPGRLTVLGEKLDMGIDTLGFLVAPLVGVAWGRLPVWYLALSAARYLFKFGRWRRRRRGLPVHSLPDSRVRRPLAGVQMAFIAVALAPVLPVDAVAVLAAVVVTPSLAVFVRDYLAVAGRLGDRGDGPGRAGPGATDDD